MKDNDGALVRRALYECALFSGLDNAHRDLVCKVAEARTLLAGAPIFLLGQEASEVLVIADGGVALQLPVAIRGKGADITIEEKGPGDVIAWSALVAPHKLTLSARTLARSTLVALRRDDLHALFHEHPVIHQKTIENLCHVIGSRVALLEALLMRDLQRWVVERFG